MYKFTTALILVIFLNNIVFGQNDQGVITYDRTLYYTKVIDGLPYLSEEERDRQKLTWGKDEGRAHPYILQFTPEQSIYTYGEKEREYSFSWKQQEFLLIHNLAEQTITQQRVMGGGLFVIEDEEPSYKWKILNEIREVAGYLCFKAETIDTIKKQTIHAWFTNEIPIASGPEGFGGLPGMILMIDINEGTAIIEATSVKIEDPKIELPKKIKGKKLSLADYADRTQKYIEQCVEGERNPFWRLRY